MHQNQAEYYLGIQAERLTITAVTMALTSPLCSMVNSTNFLVILSKFLSLPFSAKITSTNEMKEILKT